MKVKKGDRVERRDETTGMVSTGQVRKVEGDSIFVAWDDWSATWVKAASVKRVS